jgi:hypothetical protein
VANCFAVADEQRRCPRVWWIPGVASGFPKKCHRSLTTASCHGVSDPPQMVTATSEPQRSPDLWPSSFIGTTLWMRMNLRTQPSGCTGHPDSALSGRKAYEPLGRSPAPRRLRSLYIAPLSCGIGLLTKGSGWGPPSQPPTSAWATG